MFLPVALIFQFPGTMQYLNRNQQCIRQPYPSENKQKAKNVVDIRDKYVYLPVQKEKGS